MFFGKKGIYSRVRIERGTAIITSVVSVEKTGERRPSLLLLSGRQPYGFELFETLSGNGCDVMSYTGDTAVLANHLVEKLSVDLVLLVLPPEEHQLLETCIALRSNTTRPIVVLSELSDELVIVHALEIGIDEYLVLPIGNRELLARIGAMIRRVSDNGHAEIKRVGSLTLFLSDHSVEYCGRKILLSPIEFRLLDCLASAPGKVFTHDTLMTRVWGDEYVNSRHYLHLYIRYLREKLEKDPCKPKILVNEWGIGYRLQLAEE